MRSDKLQVEYLGAVKVQKREEGIPMVYDLEWFTGEDKF